MNFSSLLLALLLCLVALDGFAQAPPDMDLFEKDFEKALQEDFSRDDFEGLCHIHSFLLTPQITATKTSATPTEEYLVVYPLSSFLSTPLYQKNIVSLLQSSNSNHKLLAYLILAASGDNSFEATLLDALREGKEEKVRIQAYIALLYLKCNNTTTLFEFAADQGSINNSYTVALLYLLPLDSLIKTAYHHIESKAPNRKLLAVQVLQRSESTPRAEKALKKAVVEWDVEYKSFAIRTLKVLKIGHLSATLEPLLKEEKLYRLVLETLFHSPTKEDQAVFFDCLNDSKPVHKDILYLLYRSQEQEHLRLWLSLLIKKGVPEGYRLPLVNHPQLVSDEFLPAIQAAILSSDPTIKATLVWALKDRTDEASTAIFLQLLNDNEHKVRNKTALALAASSTISPEIVASIPDLLSMEDYYLTPLIELAVRYELDQLHDPIKILYEEALSSKRYYYTPLRYLSIYPQQQDKGLFREILLDPKKSHYVNLYAAQGLAKLQDVESIALIHKALLEDIRNNNKHTKRYLEVLGQLKTPASKAIVQDYENNADPAIKAVAQELLNNW